MSQPDSDAEAAEVSTGGRGPVPTPLRPELDDKVVHQMYNADEELVTYSFGLLDQCITLSDAVAEIHQVNLTRPVVEVHHTYLFISPQS